MALVGVYICAFGSAGLSGRPGVASAQRGAGDAGVRCSGNYPFKVYFSYRLEVHSAVDTHQLSCSLVSFVRGYADAVSSSFFLLHTNHMTPKNKPRHPGPRGSGELGEDHHNQQFDLAG